MGLDRKYEIDLKTCAHKMNDHKTKDTEKRQLNDVHTQQFTVLRRTLN